MTLLVLAILAAVVVSFVLYPIFKRSESDATLEPNDPALRSLMDKKNQLYDSIRDLDFEHQAGKLSDVDHQKLRGEYITQVGEVLARLDALAPAPETNGQPAPERVSVDSESPDGPEERPIPPSAERAPEPMPGSAEASSREAHPGAVCPSCQERNPQGARFCFQCGARFPDPGICRECGETLPARARFCSACGVTVLSQ